MKKLFVFLICLTLLLCGCGESDIPETTGATVSETVATEVVEASTVEETTVETVETTEATEPEPEYFTLTFVGDCTLGCPWDHISYGVAFVQTIGEDYGYPFRNVIDYFENDDFTMLNLEGPLCDSGTPANKKHAFRGPTVFTNILTQNSVQAVTLANNHAYDFGEAGYESTRNALTEAEVPFVEQDGTLIVTTESGLTIGMYAVMYDHLDKEEIVAAISALAADETVDLVVFVPHWGVENTYRPTDTQKELGYAAIDAGADIVYGSHTHVLQPIEEYNGGIIFYSLGNFSFGGNAYPKDYDTVLVQQQVIRDPDGTVRLGETTIVPCSISSESYHNNFQPTPYEEGTEEYDRALSKALGTFTGADLPWD